MYWEGSVQEAPNKRPFALHRNGYAGLQRYGWLWSGDTQSRWETLKAQIMDGISVGLSGIPYWGSDTGGFVPTRELTPELFVRWFQFSSFCPSFRCHGRAWKLRLPWGWNLGRAEPLEITGDLAQNWPPPEDLHRPDVEEICRKFLNLRYQMLPYIYSTAAQTHESGMPMIRAMWLMYPQDKQALLIDDQYFWGDHVLVAPIYEQNAAERNVYLPSGIWWSFWTSERLQGGTDITAKAALDSMPIFLRAGSIIPMGPVKQHSGEKSDAATVLRIYPGANGQFRWYDDAGDGFDYERGEYMSLLCDWNDSSRTLTLSRDLRGKLGSGRRIDIEIAATNTKRTVTLTSRTTRLQL
jgi:alpha-glucosidase/alpha-D-xyloside xylohydrolase